MACLTNPISQPGLDISSLSALSLATHRKDQCNLTDSSWLSIRLYSGGISFYPTVAASGRQKVVSLHSLVNPVPWFSWT
jgi:hypothetical protein